MRSVTFLLLSAVLFSILCAFNSMQLAGTYTVHKEEMIKQKGKGWDYSRRYDRTLTLLPDSSFTEINLSYECFDFRDHYGKWSTKGEKLVLIYEGTLNDDGSRESFKESGEKGWTQDAKILSSGNLLILEDGFLHKEVLKRTGNQ